MRWYCSRGRVAQKEGISSTGTKLIDDALVKMPSTKVVLRTVVLGANIMIRRRHDMETLYVLHALHEENRGWIPLTQGHICGSLSLIARFMGATWGPPGTDRTQVGPMLAPWTLLSGVVYFLVSQSLLLNKRFILPVLWGAMTRIWHHSNGLIKYVQGFVLQCWVVVTLWILIWSMW